MLHCIFYVLDYFNERWLNSFIFRQTVLHEKTQIDDGLGAPDWQLTLYLLAAWIFVFMVAFKGVKSSGKVSYFLALFPYVVLIALLIRGCTLEGSVKGILFFIEPKWEQLLNPKVNNIINIQKIVHFFSLQRYMRNNKQDFIILRYLFFLFITVSSNIVFDKKYCCIVIIKIFYVCYLVCCNFFYLEQILLSCNFFSNFTIFGRCGTPQWHSVSSL